MTKAKLLGIIRHLLTFGGGFLLAKGIIDEVYLDEIISAITTIVGFIWSVANKDKVAALQTKNATIRY